MLPIVDLTSTTRSEALRHACLNYGFFYLSNHGISEHLLTRVYQASRDFFHLPVEKKLKAVANQYMRGYTMMNEETLDPNVQTQGGTKEGYYIGRTVDADEMQYPLHGPNVWPDENDCPQFCSIMEQYHREMSALSFEVATIFAEAANAAGAFNAPGMFDKPMAALRLLHYDAVHSNISQGIFGCGAHTDYGLLTLLSTDANPGLQVYIKDQWVDIPPRCASVNNGKTMFIVNIGDMAERWTNGVFQSTRHRVVNVNGLERFSIPFFYEPNFTCRVECFPSFITDENPCKYPPTTSGEHLLERYRATHASFEKA